MELSDEEIRLIHGWLEDWVQSTEYWSDGDREEKSALFERVRDEAKRRKLWWAR